MSQPIDPSIDWYSFTFYNQPSKESTMARQGRYGFLNFLFDCFMTAITAGFWLIWVFVREVRQ